MNCPVAGCPLNYPLFATAEKTVTSHHSKIKELRAEIQNEKLKNQANDAKLQAKITAHVSTARHCVSMCTLHYSHCLWSLSLS